MGLNIKKGKFIRNIIIGIVALLIVAFIINIAPGYKRNKYENVINLVIRDENVTEKLKKPIYKDEKGIVYLSKEDIGQFLDPNIYYEQEEDMIITASSVAVATMKVGEKTIHIDNAVVPTLDYIIYENNTLYIPIEEMEIVYNIQVQYLQNEGVVIIDKLNEGMIKAEAAEETKIRFKPRGLSKQVDQLEVGDIVSAFYTTSKGWRLIRTEEGEVGYVKANVLTNEYILRQDMNQNTQTKKISIDTTHNTLLDIEEEKVSIKDLFIITNDSILLRNTDSINADATTNIWANLTMQNANVSSYNDRTKLIDNIKTIAMKRNLKGINIEIENNNKNIERFVIELAPRLKEIGIITNIIIDNLDEESESKYTGVVNYIVTK